MIQFVHIGGTLIENGGTNNSYPSIRKILNAFDIPNKPVDPHQHHFHVFVTPPKVKTIGGSSLLSDAVQADTLQMPMPNDVTTLEQAAQALLDQLRSSINVKPGDSIMFVADLPAVPPQDAQMIVAQADVAIQASAKADKVLGVCHLVQNPPMMPDTAVNAIEPAMSVENYFQFFGRKKIEGVIRTTVLHQSEHGVIKDVGYRAYAYYPEKGYLGKDRATFLVEMAGHKIRVEYFFRSINHLPGDDDYTGFCPKGKETWRISQSFDTNGVAVASDISLNMASLAGGVLGNTVDQTITLDPTAAGYNWFIDPTPQFNEEFLPTSNPYEWQAKPGSAADGKMDMLTVLWHEYGHALGLEHTAAGHDLMSATLTPGVRRLPTPEELAMFNPPQSPLIRGEVTGLGEGDMPGMPLAPFAGLPLLFTRAAQGSASVARGTMPGATPRKPTSDAVEGCGEERTASIAQYTVAANATLTNGDFTQADGSGSPISWQTQSSVIVANGSAVLREVATSQTRLSQVFMVGENDDVLRFTLDGLALDDVNGAPDDVHGSTSVGGAGSAGPTDAFEVSLTNANTGASLLGSTGLSHNDAFLNIQANGTEHKAAGVLATQGATSRTYTVDLSGIPEGTAVNLSFDLIGFGGATSHVTVRDVKLGVPMEAHDDQATTAEDTAMVIDVRANDLGADLASVAPARVAWVERFLRNPGNSGRQVTNQRKR